MPVKFTAVIADDEPLLRDKLRRYLQDVPWLDLVGEATDGPTTLRTVEDLKPDVLFLDVRMPVMSGIEVLERLKHRPTVVFTTAYDQYAVTAFELRALDYLLKPFGKARFEETISRVKETLGSSGPGNTDLAIAALRREGKLSRLMIRTNGEVKSITLSEVLRFESQGDYVAVHTADRRYLASLRMEALEQSLDPEQYVRIHRRHMVNLDHVKSIKPQDSGRFQVTMSNGVDLVASRRRSRALRKRIV